METRKKQSAAARRRAQDPEWLIRVSLGTRRAMQRPDVRSKHLRGLRRARKIHGINFKGGKGQEPVQFVKNLWKLLKPRGYVREYSVGLKGLSKGFHYVLDFALIERKIAIECDGPKHRSFAVKEKDKLKDARLKALGWRIIRVPHD